MLFEVIEVCEVVEVVGVVEVAAVWFDGVMSNCNRKITEGSKP